MPRHEPRVCDRRGDDRAADHCCDQVRVLSLIDDAVVQAEQLGNGRRASFCLAIPNPTDGRSIEIISPR